MNIICQIDPSAFATGPRMHHGEDEVALESPSSATSRRRALNALKAQNWKAAKKSGPTARDYVQDGLIAMWDGIENAGWGTYSAEVTTWVNLVDESNGAVLNGDAHWTEDFSLECSRGGFAEFSKATIPIGQVEIVMNWRGISGNSILAWDKNMSGYSVTSYNGVGYQGDRGWGATPRIPLLDVVGKKVNISLSHPTFGTPDVYLSGLKLKDVNSFTSSNGDGYRAINGNWNNTNQRRGIGNYYSVRVYNRVLTADEVAANYAVDKERFGLA